MPIQSDPGGDDLALEVIEHSPNRVVIAISGELSELTTDGFKEQMVANHTGAHELVLDMREVTFLCSLGIGALVLLNRLQREAGGTLHISDTSAIVARVLSVTGLDVLFAR